MPLDLDAEGNHFPPDVGAWSHAIRRDGRPTEPEPARERERGAKRASDPGLFGWSQPEAEAETRRRERELVAGAEVRR